MSQAVKKQGHTGEEGFTLVEMVTALTVTIILTTVIVATIAVALRATDQTARRLALSDDAHGAAAFLVRDLQSLAGDFTTSSVAVCGGAPTAVMSFTRFVDDPNGAATATATVSYVVEPAPEGRKLVRHDCAPNALDPLAVVDFLSDTDPVVTCQPGPACGAVPDVVVVQFTDCGRLPDNTCDPSHPLFRYEVRGARRTR